MQAAEASCAALEGLGGVRGLYMSLRESGNIDNIMRDVQAAEAGNSALEGVAGVLGLFLAPLVAFSEYTLRLTGTNLSGTH